MKNTKHQTPNTREAPTGKHQIPSSKLQKKSKHQTPGSRYAAWAFSAAATDDALVLLEQMNLFQFGLTNAMSLRLQPLRNVRSQVDVWSLELIWSLELGVWFFVFGVWMLGFGAL